ncbi:MAG: adenylate/guanylate cyclase domain-containing protein [Spirochaetales bacterium]|nr:adenylate/guanylate cyclase domain-containing protein [Spirochaetales bacterium]
MQPRSRAWYLRPSVHMAMYMITSLVSNIIVVTANQYVLGDLIYLADSRQIFKKVINDNSLHRILVNWLPFPVVFLGFLIYVLPLRFLYNHSREEQKNRGLLRLLNAPIVMSLLAISGWIMGVGTQYIIYTIHDVDVSRLEVLGNVITSTALSIMTFVVSFYTSDLINRRLYIPFFFPDGVSPDMPGHIHVSLRWRFEIFILAAASAPVLILTLTSLNFLNESDSPQSPTTLYALGGAFLLSGMLLAALLAAFLQQPIVRMQQAVEKIRNLDFSVHIPVTSTDEVGFLARGINEMAASLAEKEKIKDTFGKAVDPRVRDHLLQGTFNPGGETLDATVLFCDIRNFTRFSEEHTPAEVVQWLNRHFALMAGAIESRGGIINKYIGDAILAVFNAPLPLEDHARAAVLAGRDMLLANRDLQNEPGFETVKIGIGIASGRVLAGNIGSPSRLEYTVIGDTVNTASRLESLCKKVGLPLLFTRETYDQLSKADRENGSVRRAGRARVKGKSTELEIYTMDIT